MFLDPLNHQPFRCEVEPYREAVRVRPIGELDLATVPVVEEQLSELHTAGFSALTLDLRDVQFLDSTGLRMILRWNAASRADGFVFRLVSGPPAVRRLFDLTGTTAQLNFVES
jgi:anti-sigma B factor antagonist